MSHATNTTEQAVTTVEPSVSSVAHADSPRSSWLQAEWCMISTLWHRDMLRLRRERSRWLGVVLQPLMFWFLIGSGLANNFHLEGTDQTYLQFFFPGVLIMVLLFTSIFGTIALIEDRQSGFLQGVLTAPGSRTSLVLGKIAGVSSIAFIQSILFLLITPWTGYAMAAVNWWLIAASIVMTCVYMTAICFVMAWVLRTTQAYHALMSVLLIPLWILSGAMFPANDGVLGIVMQFNPMTYSVNVLRSGLEGQTTDIFGVVVLLGLCVVTVMFAAMVSRKQGGRAA